MNKNRLILIIGFLTLITPLLGIPNSIQDWMIAVYGLILIFTVLFEYFSTKDDYSEIENSEEGYEEIEEEKFAEETFEESNGESHNDEEEGSENADDDSGDSENVEDDEEGGDDDEEKN